MRVSKAIRKAIEDASMWNVIDIHDRRWDIVDTEGRMYTTYALYCDGEWQCTCADAVALRTIALWEHTQCRCDI